MQVSDRIKHAWNAFVRPTKDFYVPGGSSSSRPLHKTYNHTTANSIASTIFNRIAIDAAMTKMKHVKLNPDNDDETIINSGLHNCLTVEANIDQNHIQFLHDVVYSMFDEGVIAVVPVDTDNNPDLTGSIDILSLRVGKIVQWFPQQVEIEVYNERIGQNERIIMNKRNVAIIENPLYSVVNGKNSTLNRLIAKLNQLDDIDALASSRRLDLLITVPHKIQTEVQRKQAAQRINDIETQLMSGHHGIAYIDGSEKAIQLNRPVNPQLLESINTLTNQLYNQLGLTEGIFNGKATEEELRNYYSRSIDVIMDSITAEFIRKFLTKTARTQGHTILYYRDMFKMVPVEVIATLSDTLRRNYVATPNELRAIIGFKRSNDPRADELFNPNIADDKQMKTPVNPGVKSINAIKRAEEEPPKVEDEEE